MHQVDTGGESGDMNALPVTVRSDVTGPVNERIANPESFTRISLHLASLYWPILMQVAQDNQNRHVQDFSLIQYAKLIDEAKARHPNDRVAENAIPVSIGKTLDPINWFCRENDLPNLSCLAVDAKGKPGIGYMRNNNWEEEKAAVAAHNWAECDVQFVGALTARFAALEAKEAAKAAVKAQGKTKNITEGEARTLLSAWWYANPSAYSKISDYQRKDMIKLIRKGVAPGEAVATVLAQKSV
jgi:hypothetical protein